MQSYRFSRLISLLVATTTFCLTPTPASSQVAPDSSKLGVPPVAASVAPSTAPSQGDATAPAMPAVTLPPKGAYKHGFKIKTEYDKFEDRTITVLEKVLDDTDGFTNQSHYKLTPMFSYPGNGQTPSLDAIKITLLLNADVEIGKEAMSGAVGQQSKFADPDQRKLVFLVDGVTRVDMGSGEHGANLSKRSLGSEVLGSDRWVKEVITYDATLADWAKLANAHVLVEGRFGKKSFRLEKKQLDAIRDFTSRMVP